MLTLPNLITIARIMGSGAMLWLAQAGAADLFLATFVLLALSDWVDGKLAVLRHERTVVGARMDSIADAVLYACLLVGMIWLEPGLARSEALLIAVVITSYGVAVAASLARFRRLPAYHTRAAKICWFLVSIGAVILLLDGPVWPARVAMIGVLLTNIEATAITFTLREWRTDVPTIWHAMRRFRRE
ncbi:CDP-alcohol phosphatidyltransferase family protein [Minwuia thermotolerans]|uniref:Phosphatidylglycerophosphate synthase n=1 Tax=Minwuia thermotolerans TaxID=2056226 RepID=A0A2M9G594_9PROT|nr:CDP-alcohol phosphatidyltransferase family protein [Minwuia thermotolerans]PJK30874.1 phosphatidylglycerophosphate synthase [Minwuia thermotolerans]